MFVWLLIIHSCVSVPKRCEAIAVQGPYFTQHECEADLMITRPEVKAVCVRRPS